MNIIELAKQAGFTANDEQVVFLRVYRGEIERCVYRGEIERFATLIRNEVLEEAARVTGEFAQKWWSIHCASNKHMETTRKAHDDFCALQAAIRAMKEQS